MSLGNDEIAAVFVDRSGKTGTYLREYLKSAKVNGGVNLPKKTTAPPNQYTARWYYNMPEEGYFDFARGLDALGQNYTEITPPRAGVTGGGQYFDVVKYLRYLYDNKKDFLQKGKKIDANQLKELIEKYQKYLLLSYSTIVWNPRPKGKPTFFTFTRRAAGPTDEYWGNEEITDFFDEMAAQGDDSWEEWKKARQDLKILIGSSGLKQVEDLTFVKRGALQSDSTKIKPGTGTPMVGTIYSQLFQKIDVPVSVTQSGANYGSPDAHNPFRMLNYVVNGTNPKIVSWLNNPDNAVMSPPITPSPNTHASKTPYKVPEEIFFAEDFLAVLGLQPSFDAAEIVEIILTRYLIKLDAFTEQSLSNIEEMDPDLNPSRERIRNALAVALSKNRDLEEPNIEQLLAKTQERELFNAQCFLIRNAQSGAEHNRKRLNAKPNMGSRFKTRMVTTSHNTAATLNILSRGDSQEDLLQCRAADLSQLMPYIKIFKVVYDRSGTLLGETEFKFPNFTNVNKTNEKMGAVYNMLENNLYQEYGLKSFSWKFIGSDPFSYSNDIESTMVLYFQDFEQLSIPRESSLKADPVYRLLDLLVPTNSDPKKPNKILKFEENKFSYDIRVDVGNGGSPLGQGFDPGDSIRSLYLAMIDYDISFNQEGFFELTINYKSRLEQTLYDRETSVLGRNTLSNTQIKGLEEELKEARQDESAPQETLQALEKELNDAKLESTKATFSKIHESLIKGGNVFSMRVSKGYLFRDASTSSNPTDWFNNKTAKVTQFPMSVSTSTSSFPSVEAINNLAEVPSDPDKDIPPGTFTPRVSSNPDFYKVNFVYLIDLVQAAASIAFDSATSGSGPKSKSAKLFLDNSVVVLGDFFMYDPNNLAKKTALALNFGDIAIHYELFTKFYYEKVIKYNVTTYPLMKFIKDLISYCVLNVMDKCFDKQELLRSTIKTAFMSFEKVRSGGSSILKDPFSVNAIFYNSNQTLSVGKTSLSGHTYKKGKQLISTYLDLSMAYPPNMPRISQEQAQADCTHATIISSTAFDPDMLKISPGKYLTHRTKDTEAGIYHLDVGSAKGIVKNISFAKTDQNFLKEQRMTTESTLGILNNVFDVSIDLYGTTLFYPGQRVYINLGDRFGTLGHPYVADSFSNIMGLGGYHIVTSVESTISEGKFETKIQARWETSGDGKV